MSVKRYDVMSYSLDVDGNSGPFVKYEDYAVLEARCAALAAENAEMKEEISNITFMRDDDFFGSTQRAQEVMGRLVNVKTPETDAFLAEVRAQGAEECVSQLVTSDDDDFSDAPNICAMVAHQLRKGVQS